MHNHMLHFSAIIFFLFLILPGVHSSVITCYPMKPRAGMYRTVDCRDGFSLLIMFRASHKQWEVAILILINTSASIKFRIVEMDNWLNLNKRPCWDSIRDPFASEANPWIAWLRSLHNRNGHDIWWRHPVAAYIVIVINMWIDKKYAH